MAYDLLVEISSDLDRDLQARLLAGAYRASHGRRVALVLRGVDRDAVDRLLDPVVRRVGTGVAGVRYLEPDEACAEIRDASRGDGPCLILSRDADWLNGSADAGHVVRSLEAGLGELEERERKAVSGAASG